jgi:hypothetical protein
MKRQESREPKKATDTNPETVRRGRREVSLHAVLWPVGDVDGHRRPHPPAPNDAGEALLPHEPLHRTSSHRAVDAELVGGRAPPLAPDLARAVEPPAGRPRAADRRPKHLVPLHARCPTGRVATLPEPRVVRRLWRWQHRANRLDPTDVSVLVDERHRDSAPRRAVERRRCEKAPTLCVGSRGCAATRGARARGPSGAAGRPSPAPPPGDHRPRRAAPTCAASPPYSRASSRWRRRPPTPTGARRAPPGPGAPPAPGPQVRVSASSRSGPRSSRPLGSPAKPGRFNRPPPEQRQGRSRVTRLAPLASAA